MIAIKTQNLTKKYKDLVAVDNLNLTINQGEFISLLGINGAGKTTAIKMLTGLTKPTSGDAFLLDKSVIHDTLAVKSFIALSPQETAIANGMTVKENLQLMCGVYGFSKTETTKKIIELTKLLSLNDVLDKKGKTLSGGYQRRLSIAMALISEPKILFLDEPTLGLDVIARSELWDIISELKQKVTIILTTHYLEEAEALSDRIAIMKNGKLLVLDTADNIKKSTNTDNFEQAFISIVKGAK